MAFRLSTYWLRNDILFNLIGGKTKRKIVDCLRVLHNFSNSIILKRREELMNNSNASEHQSSVDADDGKRMALLDILLQSEIDGQPLSNEDIREEVDTFMFEVLSHHFSTIEVSFKCILSYSLFRDTTQQPLAFLLRCTRYHGIKPCKISYSPRYVAFAVTTKVRQFLINNFTSLNTSIQ